MQTQAGKSVQGDSTPGSSSSLSFDLDFFANTRTIIFNTKHLPAPPPLTVLYCTPSSESFTSFHWAPDALSNPDTLAPTVPDLTLSFIESTNWRSATPVRNSNNVSTTTDALKQSRNNNPDSTPTRDTNTNSIPQLMIMMIMMKRRRRMLIMVREKWMFLDQRDAPLTSTREKIPDHKDGSSEEQQWPQRAQSRPLSQMTFGTVGSGMMMTTMSEKSRPKPKKTFGFTIRTGRIRSSTCLENQLEDVLNQQYSPAFAEHEQTAIYRLPQSEPPRTGGHYQKAKNRSALSSRRARPPITALLQPTYTPHPIPDELPLQHPRSKYPLFLIPSFRTFNSSATDDTHPSNTTRPLLQL
ncbi:hypothetical protein PSTT_15506 [Puccinia striiformis]|uniref:Uncharacterized protein n=1 Tax=Puccinia striiformis TaxID=27350 RepID=A0A2S4UHE1_9BASI|nr:hypothetical protein PSTT_15506 [Puccinia striiformis]